MQSLLEGKAEDVARKVIEMAQAGNIRALRMCMDRIAPAPKYEPGSCELPPLENPADTVKAMATIAEAVATGDLAPYEAIGMAKVVEIYIHALQAKAFLYAVIPGPRGYRAEPGIHNHRPAVATPRIIRPAGVMDSGLAA